MSEEVKTEEVVVKHVSRTCKCGQESIVCIMKEKDIPLDQPGWCMVCAQKDLQLGRKLREKMQTSVPDMKDEDFEKELQKMVGG
jgi:hypothetical protein